MVVSTMRAQAKPASIAPALKLVNLIKESHMAVTGRVFAVMNLEALFDSYVSQPNAPEPETLAPLPNARVQLRSGLPHIPLSAEAVTGGDGTSAHDRRGLPLAALAGRNTDLPAGHDSADRGWAVA